MFLFFFFEEKDFGGNLQNKKILFPPKEAGRERRGGT